MPTELAACFVMQALCSNARDALHPGLLLQALDTLLAVMPAELAAGFVMLAHCLYTRGALHPGLLPLAHCLNARDVLHPGLLRKLLTPFWVSCQRGLLHALSCWRIG